MKQLPVRAENNRGYSRAKFRHWVDADRDGCDTREEVLITESRKKVRTGPGCRVSGGKWFSRYDRVWTKNASRFDVDHLVPLAEAWGSGARKWNASTRRRYANDLGYPASLIAVTASSNRSKGARDPAEWLPVNRKYRCRYAANYVAVKYRWRLSVNKTEKRALKRTLGRCSPKRVKVTKPSRPSIGKRTTRPATSTGGPGGTDRRYSYCYQATAAGLGPYKKGRDPEYHWYTDRDSDGWVCE